MRIVVIILLFSTSLQAQWWDTDWTRRVKITADADSVLVTDSGFLYYYALSELPSTFWLDTQNDGADIRVTEGEDTDVPFHVVEYDSTANEGGLFFKGNSHSTIDTFFYIYYGNSGASALATTATYGQYNVYTGFQYVHHLNEGLEGGSNSVKNSAANSVHGTPFYGSGTGDEVAGKLEFDASDFDGQADPRIIRMGNNATDYVPTFPFTMLAWVKADSYTDYFWIASKYHDATAGDKIWYWAVMTGRELRFRKWDASDVSANHQSSVAAANNIGVWTHFATSASSDALTSQHYEDGQTLGSSGSLTSTGMQSSSLSTNYAQIGGLADWVTIPDAVPDGSMQNIMIANTEWSANKIETYYNETDDPTTFWITASAESSSTRRIIIIN